MYSTEGIVLKKRDSGEANASFVIYTKDFGKILATAQGIKKEGAKLKGHLEVLNLSQIGFVLGKNGARLTHATVLQFWPAVRSDYEKLRLAHKIISSMDRFCLEGDRDAGLWNLLTASFSSLEKLPPEETGKFLDLFEKHLNQRLGYGQDSIKIA